MPNEKTGILAQLQAHRGAKPGPFWAVVGVAGFSLFGMVAAFGTAPGTDDIKAPRQQVVEQLVPPSVDVFDSNTAVFVREERIQRGDSVASLFARIGVQDNAAFAYLQATPEAAPLFRQLSPGKSVTGRVNGQGELLSLIFPLNGGKDQALVIDRNDRGGFKVSEQNLQLETQVLMKSAEIRYSLFGATDAAGIPDGVATQLADIFGGDIDFHRDIRKGDRFSVVFESINHQGKMVRTGRILAAEFINDGETFRAIWFQDDEGKGGYYTADGRNIRKSFLRSPLEFSRVTSGFSSSRYHPVLHKRTAHRGVDYGAPVGTRVKATGDGIVDFVGSQGGYGKLVVLRHQSRYATFYGHLSGFAPGLRKGMRVAQGDVIGLVGATGLATGPHLHYEFRVDGVHQNPLAVVLPSAPPLAANQLARFREQAQSELSRIDIVGKSNLALLE